MRSLVVLLFLLAAPACVSRSAATMSQAGVAMADPQFLKTTIILPVSDIDDTIAWYERALGFQTRYIHGSGRRGEAKDFANYAIMQRDAVEVHFILDEGGAVWTRAGTGHLGLTVRDVDAVYADVQSRGIRIDRELQQEHWPARGFNLKDPSGNEVHIEQPTPAPEPVAT